MKTQYFTLIVLFTLGLWSCDQPTIQKSAYELVNPFIGTGGHGHTYPGATLPFGMVQLSPDTRLEGWDGCSGYHYTDSIIYGFSHTHLSGTGVSDYGDVLLMPFNHNQALTYDQLLNHDITPSSFNKDSENAMPGTYNVKLNEAKTTVSVTATERVGIHQYQFDNSQDNKILLDLNHRDMVLDYAINIENETTISGYRISKAWAVEQHVYFVMAFSEPFEAQLPLKQNERPDYFRILNFANNPSSVIIKVGISATGIDGAKANLKAEALHWDFEKYKTNAKSKWEAALSKIEVKDKNEDKLTIFYSALYHTMIVPNLFSDVDGKYRGMDQKIHQTQGRDAYTIFSLWDTFRGAHPLYTIIEQDKTKAFIQSFLNHYKQGGRLPVWELSGNETDCMIGYHSVPVIADAFVKGISDFDVNLALEAMCHSAELDHFGLSAYKSQSYIAAGDESESVSKNLEYAYDDWCIATFAKALDKDSIYQNYIERAQYYQNLFNPELGFMQAKMNGGWTTGFDPAEVNFNFTEANSWQYSLFVPHDIKGLIELYGGEAGFEEKLDELFSTEMVLSGRHQADITGLIGQYAHGNEPSHHMAYLYNYVKKPYKTQEKVHQILTEQYSNAPDGLSGNEDCGQMSAWYVLSSLGFYSVTPGLDYYTIGTPHLDHSRINLENGKTFTIQTKNLSNDNIYIQSAQLNGENFNQSYIKHEDIMAGGEMIFIMGSSPNESWGSKDTTIRASEIALIDRIPPVPYFSSSQQTFTDTLKVRIENICENCEIKYSINGEQEKKYRRPILISNTATIKAYTLENEKMSKSVTANYKKIKGGRSIHIENEYSNQYSGGGDHALIDYLTGSSNFRTGYWQGYQGTNVSAIVDLGDYETINLISVGTLQDIKSWIWFPKAVKISVSNTGKSFKEVANIQNDFPRDKYGAYTKAFTKRMNDPVKVKFIKVELTYPGNCPDWHLGAGGKAWLFIDEITIE